MTPDENHGGYVLKPEVTWRPPIGCPRQADGGVGPRMCNVACRLALKTPDGRGPGSAKRLRLLLVQPDHCTLDVVDRAKASAEELTSERVGALMGISKRAVQRLEKNGLRKLRRALRIKLPG